ncbi:hypothetical protein [Leptolyngbya sp. 7M]|uniref:arsenate reductase/protein-tyrosine-phosphatase family protein n=1 Tax=Leptolyngbya sp. 7M TaxID=2812896 RepID=UPI001B8A9ADD|nr:hypothetical protein [Leptolyngbya sp. 7M]QYO64325.1 hypothetical protein JVX88_32235 [Leptolyngbya sp. 7M]
MALPYKLLFVCLGNICRSPSAEGIMNHLIRQRGLEGQIICDSAGTSSYHVGSPPDRRMTAAAARRPDEMLEPFAKGGLFRRGSVLGRVRNRIRNRNR